MQQSKKAKNLSWEDILMKWTIKYGVTNVEKKNMSYELLVTSLYPRVTSSDLRVQIQELHVRIHKLKTWVARLKAQVGSVKAWAGRLNDELGA